ncbi:MAG: PQQ-binding-like beta-propeller repeat protein [Thermaerobacter sp.]|nr:PQQ-binding-like beta-propeller repeat protein [Thermaerobacter sp.]
MRIGRIGYLVPALGLLLASCGPSAAPKASPPAGAGTHPQQVSAGPLPGNVYIADEEGNRILEVNPQQQIVWQAQVPAPDDVAPTPGGNLIVNADARDLVYEVNGKTGKIIWSYGHLNHPGNTPGYLSRPEDSFAMSGGRVDITDPGSFLSLVVRKSDHRILWSYGHAGVPGILPGYLWENNDTVPLQNGDFLITEAIPHHARVFEVTPQGKVRWTANLPGITYPSDAMPVGPDRYVIADYTRPGSIDVFNRQGKILWSYGPKSGPGMLNYPSSAEMLSNGNYLVSDDKNDRVVVISPQGKIVWQYGHTGVSSAKPGYLVGNTDAKAAGQLLPPFVPYAR